MPRTTLSLVVALLLSLAGCTQLKTIPATAYYEQTDQYQIMAARHWDLVADHVSKQILVSLGNSDLVLTRPVVYVAPPDNSVFGQALHGFLLSHLVAQGMRVTTSDQNYTMKIDYDTQVVHHGNRGFELVPGALTALGVGAWVVRGLLDASPVVSAIGTAAGTLAADQALQKYDAKLKPQPNTEIILDVYATTGDHYVAHHSNIYYINDPDRDHYVHHASGDVPGFAGKMIKVVSE